jgi:opacity protein-like surface antigen
MIMKSGNFTLAAAIAVALGAAAASQQVMADEPAQELEVYAGAAFGDRIVDNPVAGRAMRVDDDATFGARYTFWTGSRIGLQLAGGITPTSVRYTQGGDTDADAYTVDANVLFDLTPDLVIGGHKVQTYAALGAGYAWLDPDKPIVGAVGSVVRTLDDQGGFTANAGLGARLYLTDKVYAGLDARYRYIDKLVKSDSRSLDTVETSLSIGYRF